MTSRLRIASNQIKGVRYIPTSPALSVAPQEQSIQPMIGNWYFNPNTKLMFNYVRAMIDHDNYKPALGEAEWGNLYVFQMRVQVDF